MDRGLFSRAECRKLLGDIRSDEQIPPLVWPKGCATTSPAWANLARQDRIVEIVVQLLGPDVILWGASLVIRSPGQIHQWHNDLESSTGEGFISVWMGLTNTDRETSLRLVPKSHLSNILLFQLAKNHGVLRHAIEDKNVIEWARAHDPDAAIQTLDTRDGDALFFDGRLWHGSQNGSRFKKRVAVLLQYARADQKVRIPKFGHQRWPMVYLKTPKPPCLLIRGHGQDGQNDLIPGPHAAPLTSRPAITTLIEPLDIRPEDPGTRDLKIFDLLEGPTTDLRLMECHYSVLAPGKIPHPPHVHDEEEIQIIVTGQAEFIAESKKGSGRMERFPAGPGDFIYHPANWRHTHENTSDTAVVYVVFKWVTDEYQSGSTLPSTFVQASSVPTGTGTRSRDMDFRRLMEGRTDYLRTLEAHMTTLLPGQGYEPHRDGHDVAIVLLQGRVETMGETVDGPAIFYYAAGEKHGLRNVGPIPSRHVAFELHGKHGNLYETAYARRIKRIVKAIRHPSILVPALKRRLRRVIKRTEHIWPVSQRE